MSNFPKGTDPNEDPDANLIRLVTGVKRLAKSDGLATWLNKHLLLGNIAFAILMGYSGYSIIHNLFPNSASEVSGQQIVESNMDAVCMNERFYRQKLKRYSSQQYTIQPLGVEYKNDTEDVHPVFRWACKYSITDTSNIPDSTLDNEPLPSGSAASPNYVYTGISLDEHHCEPNFKELKFTKAIYLHADDPNSWYCANTNANF